jgi:hypothetical protein
MYEKDYIMRMVEAFARMISIIMGFREKGELDSAYGMILEAYGSVLKVDPGELENYTQAQWNNFYRERTSHELEMLADLMKLEGEILTEKGKPEVVLKKQMKALELLIIVEEKTNTYSQARVDNISELKKKLSGSDSE